MAIIERCAMFAVKYSHPNGQKCKWEPIKHLARQLIAQIMEIRYTTKLDYWTKLDAFSVQNYSGDSLTFLFRSII